MPTNKVCERFSEGEQKFLPPTIPAPPERFGFCPPQARQNSGFRSKKVRVVFNKRNHFKHCELPFI